MSNTVCLFGPSFALVGKDLLVDENGVFEVKFNSPADKAAVIRYEWYLNDVVVPFATGAIAELSLPNGKSEVGVRLLVSQGWSGIKTLNVKSFPLPVFSIVGPKVLEEGKKGSFSVIAKYTDYSTSDVTSDYIFESSEGFFSGNILSIPINTNVGDSRNITITAKKGGMSVLQMIVFIRDTSKRIVVKKEIIGPDSVVEGDQATYGVLVTYSGGYSEIDPEYLFYTTEGVFDGNTLIIPLNTEMNSERGAFITAVKPGEVPIIRLITILNFDDGRYIDCAVSSAEGRDEKVRVMRRVPNQPPIDETAYYTLSAAEGIWDRYLDQPHTLSFKSNAIEGDTRQISINAHRPGFPTLTKKMWIQDYTKYRHGIGIIEFWNCPLVRLYAIIENVEIAHNNIHVDSTNNILPPNALVSDAYLVASELGNSHRSWRFLINLKKIGTDFPNVKKIRVTIFGQADVNQKVYTAYGSTIWGTSIIATEQDGRFWPEVYGTGGGLQLAYDIQITQEYQKMFTYEYETDFNVSTPIPYI